ncbi:stage II sporulation protein R [Neobacillus sp. MM2021_6]|uniref:stage II sporulation protein R n=1 Tax=Bacillaceae TaxID=186817 RepID=UPI001408ACFA|nr:MULTISPECIES: stage II sporulation protein R [Bacillaceae]MBO0958587.1 stage II sporulation protein R [Neobacillus sp. MM2021_6]NHC18036.1 stage II sporulation protein R [Bacillus sp. MM2020_4]
MRSKLIVWGYLVVLSLGTMLSLYMPKTEAAAKESIVIPGEAIRLRILANSDFEKDQAIKRKVRDAVNAQITLWVQDLTSMQEAKKLMTSRLPEIQAIAEKVVHEQGSDQSVKVEFGKVQFPTKLYGQFLYPAGEYQAILITLGSGEGANWWCVLYPPLCFLDFSNGVAVSDGFEEEKQVAKAETVSEQAAPEQKVKEKEKVVVPVNESVKPEKKEMEPVKEDMEQEKGEEKEVASTPNKKVVEVDNSLDNDKQKAVRKDKEVKKSKKHTKKTAPVYTAEDEEPVKVKFFVAEMWEKMFN